MEFAFLLTKEMYWTQKEITSQTAKLKIERERILRLFPTKKNQQDLYKIFTKFISLLKKKFTD